MMYHEILLKDIKQLLKRHTCPNCYAIKHPPKIIFRCHSLSVKVFALQSVQQTVVLIFHTYLKITLGFSWRASSLFKTSPLSYLITFLLHTWGWSNYMFGSVSVHCKL